jgi:hypothetical protein
MHLPHREFLFAGYFVGHPAERLRLPALPPAAARARLSGRGFGALEAAVLAAAACVDTPAVHGLWLPKEDAARLLDEEAPAPGERPSALWRAVQLQRGGLEQVIAEAAGWDVLAFAGDTCWRWRREAGRELLQQLAVAADDDDLIADGEAAVALAEALNGEELGPPAQWRRFWRTRHRAG